MNASPQHIDIGLSSLDGVATVVLDERGVVLDWSQEAADLLDWTASEVRGKPIADLVADDPAERWLAEADSTAAPTAGRAMMRHRSGRVVEVVYRVLA
ncbi:PAS domain-containing protein, partial [Streptomyces sp. NPDC005799]|uniref:PAS domain-containing protein n=1 Tax=Streptomyces sp. NPDC005799 TaxID=3154678 RepID=UPI00340ECE78